MKIITQNPDPVTALVGASIGIASLFGLFTYLGWTSDQVGQFGGFALMIVYALKALFSKKKTGGDETSQGNTP